MKQYFSFLLLLCALCSLQCSQSTETDPAKPVVKIISPKDQSTISDNTTIDVQASDDKGVTKVEIYIDNTLDSSKIFLKEPYTAIWNINKEKDSSVHVLVAKAYDADNNVTSSQGVTVTVFNFTPSNLATTLQGDTAVFLQWKDNSTIETGFDIEQSADNIHFTVRQTMPPNAVVFILPGAYSKDSTYYFRMRAHGLGGTVSSYSNTASVKVSLPPPNTLSIATSSSAAVTLQWNDSSLIERGFEIERAINKTNFIRLVTLPANTTTYQDKALDSTQTYSYRVRAVTSVNTSAYTSVLKIGFVVHSALLATYSGHTNDVLAVAVSPKNTMFASASSDYTAKLWQRSDGKLLSTLTGHQFAVTALAFSPDGLLLASGSNDNSIKIWNTSSGALLHTFSQAHSNGVSGVVFSSDGQSIIGVGGDNAVKFQKISDGAITQTLTGHSYKIHTIALNPSGTIIATGSADNVIKLWNTGTGAVLQTISGHTNAVNSVAFSADGLTLASGSSDNSIKLWRVSDGVLLNTFTGHAFAVNGVSINQSGELLASASEDNTIKIWRIRDGSLLTSLKDFKNVVRAVQWSPDGKTLVSGDNEKNVKIWNIEYGWNIIP